MMTRTLEDAGWKGGLEFARITGRVKLSQNADLYPGRWVDFVEANADGVVVFIHPARRFLRWDEVTEFRLTTRAFREII